MALPKSGRTGSNVLKLDDVRRKRTTSAKPTKPRPCSVKSNTPASASRVGVTAEPSTVHARRRTDKPVKNVSERITPEAVTVRPSAAESPAKGTKKSKTTPARISNRRFDKVKVERIKSEISRGEYRINFLQVADKFIEHERYS